MSYKQCMIGLTALWLSATSAFAGELPALKSDQDKMNYAVGVNLMKNVRLAGVEVDLDIVFQGMRDAYRGDKLLLSDDELRKIMSYYQSEVKQKRMLALRNASAENRRAGDAFLAENAKKDGVMVLPSGLQYKVLKTGTGRKPVETDTVECRYRGTLISGTEFDHSPDDAPASLKLAQLIPGWKEALKLMPLGSKWQLFIPSNLAYRERGAGALIGPNATLVFEIELLAIK